MRKIESNTESYREQFLEMDKATRRRKIRLDVNTIKQNVAVLKWLKRELAWKKAHLNTKQLKQEQQPQDLNTYSEP